MFPNPGSAVLRIAAERLEQGIRQPPPDTADFTLSVDGLELGRNTTEHAAAAAIVAGIAALLVAACTEAQNGQSRRRHVLRFLRSVTGSQDSKHILVDWLSRLMGDDEGEENEAAWFAKMAKFFSNTLSSNANSACRQPGAAVGMKGVNWQSLVEDGVGPEPDRSVNGKARLIPEYEVVREVRVSAPSQSSASANISSQGGKISFVYR